MGKGKLVQFSELPWNSCFRLPDGDEVLWKHACAVYLLKSNGGTDGWFLGSDHEILPTTEVVLVDKSEISPTEIPIIQNCNGVT
ncbi:hypothetical protein KKF61_03935 [Patescibacteria group bacterium]|nr:hypothetical protein [Patescibacteria group bacterium]MBU0964379.1 hypothetical protein [Patescibacteria group bacterium]